MSFTPAVWAASVAKRQAAAVAANFDKWWKLDAATGCHVWQGRLKGKEIPKGGGYPVLKYNNKTIGGHRFAYERTYGPIPKGLHIMHLCNNTKCVNPAHLKAGTNLENQQHAAACGRRAKKLNEEAVRDIRRNCKEPGDQAKMARKYGITPGEVTCIRQGKRWKHVDA